LPAFSFSNYKHEYLFECASQLVHSLHGYHSFFDVQVIDDHSVYLRYKDEPQLQVVSTIDTYFSHELFLSCEQIKNKLRDRGSFKKNDTWLADIRFADHIIVRRG
jgi:hypothetical protein